MGLDDAVAFGVERHGADVRPVARVARPSRRVECASLEVQRVTGHQDGAIVAGMSLRRADVADAAVSMIDVGCTNARSRRPMRAPRPGQRSPRPGTRAGVCSDRARAARGRSWTRWPGTPPRRRAWARCARAAPPRSAARWPRTAAARARSRSAHFAGHQLHRRTLRRQQPGHRAVLEYLSVSSHSRPSSPPPGCRFYRGDNYSDAGGLRHDHDHDAQHFIHELSSFNEPKMYRHSMH